MLATAQELGPAPKSYHFAQRWGRRHSGGAHPEPAVRIWQLQNRAPATTGCVGFLTETRNSPRIAPFESLR